ncbi:MAG: NDP-sugar synthase [bacterium]|nr:NDP-sugar synthase [bacterium]
MDAIVLAAGRGRRMGALTIKRQKAALAYLGQSLLEYVLNVLITQQNIDQIWVTVGYRANDTRRILSEVFADKIQTGKIKVINASCLQRDYFGDIAYSVKEAKMQNECLVCGIDTRLNPDLYVRFLSHVATLNTELCMIASPWLGIAPSHPILKVVGDKVVDYIQYPLKQSPISESGWLSTTGTRYISGELLEEIRAHKPDIVSNIGECIQRMSTRNSVPRAFIFDEPWLHFGVAYDFVKET